MMFDIGRSKFKYGVISVVALCLLVTTGCTRFIKHKPGEEPDLSQPRHSLLSYSVERLNSGFMNLLYAPFEIFYQLNNEIARRDPIRGFVPGLARGVAWTGLRAIVGAFEVVTFYAPWKPHLKEFDMDWAHA